MHRRFAHLRLLFAALLIALATGATQLAPTIALAASMNYYLDCTAGNDANSGTSPQQAWKSVGKASATTLNPGDKLLLKRGTTCSGQLWPKGSGTSAQAFITLGAYGSGALPIIDGGDNESAVKLFNQQYWHIQNIETTGGNPYGIYISGDTANTTLRHFRITNVVAHDVRGVAEVKNSGMIVVQPGVDGLMFADVVIDGANVYNTQQWSGIFVLGGTYPTGYGSNITVRNSTAHNTYGEGIVVFTARNVLMEKNVAYETGLAPSEFAKSIGTPNGIWTFNCRNCTVQQNEVYRTHSPDIDGGAFDIDYRSDNTTVQYNYGHDADAYCVAVFSSDNYAQTNSVVRYNVCANNGRAADGDFQGDIYILTFGGSLDGVQIYNNTSYWNPVSNVPAVKFKDVVWSGSRPNFFKNNIVYSTVPSILFNQVPPSTMPFDNNLYYYSGSGTPEFRQDCAVYRSFGAYKRGTGQDTNSIYADPKFVSLNGGAAGFALQPNSPAIDAGTNAGNMGNHDYQGNSIPQGNGYDIGAIESPYKARAKSQTDVTEQASSTDAPEATSDAVRDTSANLIRNGSFESGTFAPWANCAADITRSEPYQGRYAVQLKREASSVSQRVRQLVPGTAYRFSAYVTTKGQVDAYLSANNFGAGSAKKQAAVTEFDQGYKRVDVFFIARSTTADLAINKPDPYNELAADAFTLQPVTLANGGANVVQNGGFENGLTGWDGFGSPPGEAIAPGYNSAKRLANVGAYAGISQSVAGWSAGKQYQLSAFGYQPGGDCWVGLKGGTGAPGETQTFNNYLNAWGSDWTQDFLLQPIPANTTWLQVYVYNNSGSTGCNLDNITLTEQP